jgi:vesicle coat complex subunit
MDKIDRLAKWLGKEDYPKVDIQKSIAELGDAYPTIRTNGVRALWNAARHGQDMTAAIPALEKALSDKEPYVREKAANALSRAATDGTDITIAVPALAKMLSDSDAEARAGAISALGNVVEKCPSLERLGWIEAKLRESRALKREERQRKEEFARVGVRLSKLTNQIAKKKNSLAADRDIMLADIPKPPKGGTGIYQLTRRAVGNV